MEPQRKTCAEKRILHSDKVKGLTGTAEVRSGIDVTALTLPRFPMLGREPYEAWFQGGTEIRGFNQIEKFLRQITPQNKLYCFSEKKFGRLGAL